MLCVGLVLPHELLATTEIFPVPAVPATTLIEVVPCPFEMVHPEGTVQV